MTQTVSVGCKLPAGLILEMGIGTDQHQKVTVIGSNGRHKGHGNLPGCMQANGYGITFGVPKDFMDAWMEKHKSLDAVRNGLIFALPQKDAVDMAKAFEQQKSGFEQIDPAAASAKAGIIMPADKSE